MVYWKLLCLFSCTSIMWISISQNSTIDYVQHFLFIFSWGMNLLLLLSRWRCETVPYLHWLRHFIVLSLFLLLILLMQKRQYGGVVGKILQLFIWNDDKSALIDLLFTLREYHILLTILRRKNVCKLTKHLSLCYQCD